MFLGIVTGLSPLGDHRSHKSLSQRQRDLTALPLWSREEIGTKPKTNNFLLYLNRSVKY